jgi:hypothetical protein
VASQEELLPDFAAAPTLDRLVQGLNQYIGSMFLPSVFGPSAPEDASRPPTRVLGDLVVQTSQAIDGRPYWSPWAKVFGAPIPASDGGYFLSNDRRLRYVVIDLAGAPRTFTAERAVIRAVRNAIADLRPQFPTVEAGVTGAPALFSDELIAATRDGQIASVLALILTLALLLLAFRRLVVSCAMLAVLALSLCWSLGVVTLLVGQLTIFSMMFVSVVIGLGIDYGIYFLFRYREERVFGATLLGALERTAARSGPGILLGALTAAVTFYILTTAEFRGIRDFGLISGTAILLAFLAMLTVFPAALLLIERRQKAPRPEPLNGGQNGHGPPGAKASVRPLPHVPALEWLARHPKTIVTTSLLATAASLWAASGVGFDYNMLNLQAEGTESVVWERKAAAAAERSVFAALSTATSLAELEARQAAFRRLPSVSDVQASLSVLPTEQTRSRRSSPPGGPGGQRPPGPSAPLDLRALAVALET